jgi:hypothetical protein
VTLLYVALGIVAGVVLWGVVAGLHDWRYRRRAWRNGWWRAR